MPVCGEWDSGFNRRVRPYFLKPTAFFSQVYVLDPEHPLYSRPALAALKELAVKGPLSVGVFTTLVESAEVFDTLVDSHIVSRTMDGGVKFHLRAVAWNFSSMSHT